MLTIKRFIITYLITNTSPAGINFPVLKNLDPITQANIKLVTENKNKKLTKDYVNKEIKTLKKADNVKVVKDQF